MNKVIIGDCLTELKKLPENGIDLMVTDPPYKQEDVDSDYWPTFAEWFREIQRVTKEYVIFFHNASAIYDVQQVLGRPHRILIWTKGVVRYAYRWEPVFIYKGNDPSFKINKHIWSDHLPFQPLHKKQSCHPYQKPPKLIERLFSYLPYPEMTVCDCFAGSGSIGVVAQQLGRKFILIEKNEKYLPLINRRLSQESLFAGDSPNNEE